MKLKGFVCDRCGAHFDRNRIKDKDGDITRTIVGVAQIDLKNNLHRYDLCDDCLNQFRSWITNPDAFLCSGNCAESDGDAEEGEE